MTVKCAVSEQTAPLKILIADDDGPNRILLREICYTKGYIVDTAEDGAQAIEKLKEKPDVLLVDLAMPKISGTDVAKQAIDQGVSVIVISANPQNNIKEQLKAMGVLAFIEKPFRLFELTHKLNQISQHKISGQQDIAPVSLFSPPKLLRSELRRVIHENHQQTKPWSIVAIRFESELLEDLEHNTIRSFGDNLIKACGAQQTYQLDDFDLFGIPNQIETAWVGTFKHKLQEIKNKAFEQENSNQVQTLLSTIKIVAIQLIILPNNQEIDVDQIVTKTKRLLQEASSSSNCIISTSIGGRKQTSSRPPPSSNSSSNKRPS